jgi:hypothetical protein
MNTRLAADLCIVSFLLTLSPMAYGLDKQRSCHSGDVAGEASGFDVSGTTLVGVAWHDGQAVEPRKPASTSMRTCCSQLGQKATVSLSD